jgi:hypothetical protein
MVIQIHLSLFDQTRTCVTDFLLRHPFLPRVNCPAAQETWTSLGLHEIIEDAMTVDRSGSVVLEEIMCRNSSSMPGFNDIGLKEVVAITSWNIWWVHKRHTHNEDVPPLFRRKMSILAIAANSAREQSSLVLLWRLDGPDLHHDRSSSMLMHLF